MSEPQPLRKTPPADLVARCLTQACKQHGIDKKIVLAGDKGRVAVAARWDAIRAIHSHAPDRYSKAGIARRLGVHHATVIYALKTEQDRDLVRQRCRAAYGVTQ